VTTRPGPQRTFVNLTRVFMGTALYKRIVSDTMCLRTLLDGGDQLRQTVSILAESLGSATFKQQYRLRYAYLAGAMYKGIASKELIVAMGQAGMMGYFGTGGMAIADIEAAIQFIQAALPDGQSYGMNLLCYIGRPELERRMVELFIEHDVRFVDAAAFVTITSALVLCRSKGLKRAQDGTIERPRRIMGKVSRPEVAAAFMRPAPESLLKRLLEEGAISQDEAELSRAVPMADEICVEADSGGHTDQGVALALIPAIIRLRDELTAQYRYDMPIHVGAAGGIGTPHAAAAAFILGADFIVTGSINQCTVEAGTSDSVKNILEQQDIHDTTCAPAGDMFELGAKVQVAKRGLFFPVRANKLHELYRRHSSLDEIDAQTQRQIQEEIFNRSFDEIWAETLVHYAQRAPDKMAELEINPKKKMAMIFKWYFVHSTRLAMRGIEADKVNYQIHCGPAMGAFNRWVKGTQLQSWRHREVAAIGHAIMQGAAAVISERVQTMLNHNQLVDRTFPRTV
jgi:trans-AT polyketide synthase, acyltransferase and oxidoreductase domains